MAPFWFRDVFINTIGYRESEKALQLGLLYSPEEAIKIKLIDEICAPNDLLAKAEEQMLIWSKIPSKKNITESNAFFSSKRIFFVF